MLALSCLSLAAAPPPRPTFSTQYSARIDEVEQQGLARRKMSCDMHNDGVANLTSYRNCGWKGTQMQMVVRFSSVAGPDAKIFYIYGHGPFGDKCAYWCDGQGDIQCNIQESLCQYDYTKSASYVGPATLNGTECDVFKWEDKVPGCNCRTWQLPAQDAERGPLDRCARRAVHTPLTDSFDDPFY